MAILGMCSPTASEMIFPCGLPPPTKDGCIGRSGFVYFIWEYTRKVTVIIAVTREVNNRKKEMPAIATKYMPLAFVIRQSHLGTAGVGGVAKK